MSHLKPREEISSTLRDLNSYPFCVKSTCFSGSMERIWLRTWSGFVWLVRVTLYWAYRGTDADQNISTRQNAVSTDWLKIDLVVVSQYSQVRDIRAPWSCGGRHAGHVSCWEWAWWWPYPDLAPESQKLFLLSSSFHCHLIQPCLKSEIWRRNSNSPYFHTFQTILVAVYAD